MKSLIFFNDKVVIITGSSMGIGKELARQVLTWGGMVVITGRNEERLAAVKKEFSEYGKAVLTFQGDITSIADNERMVKETVDHFGRVDVLIANAGLSCFGEIGVMKADVARQIIDTNIYGSLYPLMAAMPELEKTNGSVQFISSIAGLQGLPGYSSYCLSKMSLKALAQSLRIEMKNKNMFVGISYVGFTENEEAKKTLGPDGEWVSVPSRPRLLTNTREQTAFKILRQIKNRKHSQAHCVVGSFTKKLSQFFPSTLSAIIRFNYQTPSITYSINS